jgi:stearoyl-CoA desaturase (delta-9 desaturase)
VAAGLPKAGERLAVDVLPRARARATEDARAWLSRALLSHPIQRFRRDPRFYLRYDGGYFVLCATVCAALALPGVHPLFAATKWTPAMFAVGFPAVLFCLIYCHLWIHNATHGNFPRWANRAVGEILGAIVFVRFASWQIVHLRHHAHSDDPVLDPHPTFPSYFKSFFRSIVTVERQLQDSYCELWGETPENRAYEAFRAKVSYATNVALAAAWYLLLGPVAFFAFWLPCNLLAAAFVGHFNWATHNGDRGADFRPVNLDHGYYWLGNRLFTGIYFHANHHTRPHLFNPRRWSELRYGPQDRPVDEPRATS